MPYEHIEEIGDRSEERFALGLGARNMIGLVVSVFPVMFVSGAWPVTLRILAVVGAGALGLAATIDVYGIPGYAWPLYWMRGRIARLLHTSTITPDDLPGVAAPALSAPLRVGGPIRRARRASVCTTAVRAVSLRSLSIPIPPEHKEAQHYADLSTGELPSRMRA